MVTLRRDPSGLYLPDTAPGRGAFFFVFADAANSAATIDVAAELNALRGFFVFTAAIPASAADREALARTARSEMQARPLARIGWLGGSPSRLTFALQLERGGSGVRIAPEQTGLNYKDAFGLTIREALGVSFQNDEAFEIDNSAKRCTIVASGGVIVRTLGPALRVSALGTDAGRIVFDVSLNASALDALDVGLRIFHRTSGPFPGVASTRYPLFDAAQKPLALEAALDPLDVVTRQSTEGLAGTSLRFRDAEPLSTNYRTASGHPLELMPRSDARLAFCDRVESQSTTAQKYYLVPAGDFTAGAPDAGLRAGAAGVQLLAGATGTEYLSLQAPQTIRFVPGMPAMRADAPAASGPFLEGAATTSWMQVTTANAATYVGEPEDAPLYGMRPASADATVLETAATTIYGFLEESARTLTPGAPALPILPLGGVRDNDLTRALEVEADVVSRHRNTIVSNLSEAEFALADAPAPESAVREAMTPHGLIRRYDAANTEDLLIGRAPSGAEVAFHDLNKKFHDAVGRSRLLLVIGRNGGAFGTFASQTEIAKWQFDLQVAIGDAPGDLTQQAIVILKFDDRPLLTLLEQPKLWAEPDTFNADVDRTRQFLLDYFRPVVSGNKREHRRLRDALTRPTWNGVLAINVTFEVPAAAKCLASGLPETVRAHHIALELSDVAASGTRIQLRDSSFFGLIDYAAPFAEPQPSDQYAFQVTRLQVLFENSTITDFQCDAILFARQLFDDGLTAPARFKLAGHYENHDGKETYSFLNEDAHQFAVDSPVVRSVTIRKIALITTDPNESDTVSQFLLTGSIAFHDLSELLGIDYFSFEALHFDRAGIEMRKRPGEKPRFSFLAGDIGIDVRLNDLRGLLKHFPLKLKRFRRWPDGISLPDLGMLPLFENVATCRTPLYGLFFDLDLGSFGGLASSKDFKAELLLAWCGSSMWGGIRLPESKGGPKSIGLQGVIQILVDRFAFKSLPPDVYALVLGGCAVEILGTRFPAGERPDIYIFVDPKRLSDGQNAGIGWLLNTPKSDPIGPFTIERFVLGQRVGPNLAVARTVTEALAQLDALPVTRRKNDTDPDPINHDLFAQTLANLYHPDRGWLIGTKLEIEDALTFGFIFNDPVLYGALLEIPKPVDFRVEITYRKVTENIGVYHAEITLPESIRQWDFGAVSITIPTVAVSVFTNGDFLLDVGYPHDLNFARSCTIQVLPFLGSGGFYYGKLSPETSTALPVEGLDTVVEIGFGMRIGLGKEFSKGILRAGLSVAIYGLLEGALGYEEGAAWTDPSEYLLRGRVGVIAQIFGVVDFGIVKAGVAITLSVGIGIELGSRVDTVLWIEGRVSVQVTIVIGRIRIWRATIEIRISFSFSTEVRFSWVLERKQRAELAAAALEAAPAAISWTLPAPPAAKTPLQLYFLPEVTLRADGNPYAVALLAVRAPEEGSAQTDFDRLVDELVRWTVLRHFNAVSGDRDVLPADLEALAARLHVPKTLARTREADAQAEPLDYAKVAAFLAQTFDVTLSGVENENIAATFFPIVPDTAVVVTVNGTAQPARELWKFSPRDVSYQDAVAEYFRNLAVNLDPVTRASAGGPSKSLSTIVFEDYFDFLIKAAVDLLWRRLSDKQEPGKPPRPESLAALLAETAFDDLAGMAARFFKQGLRVPIDASQQSTEALYELLGTQVRIPSSATTFEVALTPRGDVAPWFAVGSVAPRLEIDDPPALFAELASLKIEPKAKITQVVPVTTDQRRFALQRWSEWDRAGQAELLWTLPEALTRELRSGNAGTLKLEVSKTEHAFRDAEAEEITGAAWATRVDLTIRRVSRRDGTIIPNVYEVGGATERNRHDLDELLQVIGALAPRIELLYRAGTRLRSDAVAASDVLLFRGNYSTETTPPPEVLSLAMAAAEVPRDRATMDDAAAFLTLAQECSLVNTGGYFLRYGDGAVNLDAAFSTGADVAVISLVVTGTGTAARRHHNALAIAHAGTIAEAVKDESRLVFYAESSKREVIARLEPGCIAFAVERENPELLPDSLGRDLEILYNLLEYRVPQQPGIRASKESLPLTPVRRDANDTAWHYEQVIPIHALADPPGRYAAVGKKVVVDFDFRDCFGNKLGWKGAGARQTFDVLYFDRLLGAGAWPSVASTYTVQKAGADARIVITLAFDPKPFESQTQDARRDVAARFARIAEQLTGPGVSIAVRASLLGTKAHQLTTQQRDDLVAFVRRVHSFLGKGGTPPGATTLMVPVPRVVETPAFFELTVSLEIARDARLVDPSAVSADDEEARRVETFIPPFTPAGGTTAASLREFAGEIEAAIPAIRVAVGSASRGGAGVWAVRIGAGGALSVEVDAAQVRFYSIPPITTARIPGDVDFDVLGRRFLDSVDWFVGAELAPRISALDPGAFDAVATHKRTLAGALANQLTPLLRKHDPAGDPLLDRAREELRQKLLISLATAYKVDVVLGYPCTVRSPEPAGARAPQLYGTIVTKPAGGAPAVPLGIPPAKLEIGTAGTAMRPLAFLLDVFTERNVSSLTIDLAYAVTHLEYFVSEDRFSRWLKFVTPLPPELLGTPRVPVPLRQYPSSPLIEQSVVNGGNLAWPTPIARARAWTYEVTFDADNAAQDTLTLEVEVNVGPRAEFALAAELTLEEALARFDREYPPIETELRAIAATGAGDVTRIAAYVALVELVTDAWSRHRALGATAATLAATTPDLRYDIREERPADDRIVVSATRFAAGMPLPETMRIDKWRLTSRRQTGNTVTFTFTPQGTPATTRGRVLVFPPFDVLREENAWGAVTLARNAVLAGEPAHEQFIYRTPTVKAAEPVVVLRSDDAVIDVGAFGTSPAPLVAHLENLFDAVLAGVTQPVRRVKVETRYAFDLRPGGPAARVPLQLTPPFELEVFRGDDWARSSYVKQLNAFITAWQQTASPSEDGALLFDVTVFAAAGAETLPVLQLTRLRLRLKDVMF